MRILLILASAAALAACGPSGNGNGAPQGGMPPAEVGVVAVQPKAVAVPLEYTGQVAGSREVEVRARVTGILEKRLYDEGATVAAGSSLFLLDAAPYELAMEQAKASLLEHRARRELAETEAERLAPLAETRAIPQREVDQALANAKTAAAAVAAAEARLKEAELNLSYTKIAAPMSGVTGRALRSEGSLVAANTDLLTTIVQVDPIWVRFSLAEADFERIRGQERAAQVRLLDREGNVTAKNGRLNFAASTVDPKLGTVQLRAEFRNGDQRWLPFNYDLFLEAAWVGNPFLAPTWTTLDANAQAQCVLSIPPFAWLAGLTTWVGGVTFDPAYQIGIKTWGVPIPVTIIP